MTKTSYAQICFIALVAVACAFLRPAAAQDFPQRAVRIISPYPAGIGPDLVMRVVAEQLSQTWKQPVVIDARTGGSGIPAMEALKAAAPDGHTLAVAGDAQLAINPFVHRSLPYDPRSDFAPIMRLISTPFVIIVAAKGPYQSVPDLIAEARSAPGKVSYGAIFVASPVHLGAAQFASLINAQMVFVPYRDNQQMLVNIANGELGWTLSTTASAAALIEKGMLKPIAIAQKTRSPSFPDIPTVAEAGGPELVVQSWLALLAPRGTPPKAIQQINTDVTAALASPAVVERLRSFGYAAEPSSPEELAKLIDDEMAKNGELIRRIGLTPQ